MAVSRRRDLRAPSSPTAQPTQHHHDSPTAEERSRRAGLPQVIKVYITLAGDLEGATEVDALFERPQFSDDFRMVVTIQGKQRAHVLKAEKLAGPIDCDACKWKLSKNKDKVIVTLKKAHKMGWGQLRANVCLPYRRGGAN